MVGSGQPTKVEVSILIQKAQQLIEAAKESIEKDETDEALIKADQALELSLKDACLFAGCDEHTVQDGKEFVKWGVTQYINFLDGKKSLSRDEKVNFFQFHNWRNPAQHSGMIIHPKQVRQVIEAVEAYVEKRKSDYNTSFQFPMVIRLEPASIDEKADIAPIFRATPSLIEPGLRLVVGEKYLSEGLKHIDLLLHDAQSQDVYVEIKWSSFSHDQVENYVRLIDSTNPHARILWVVPKDISVSLPKRVELVQYDRTQFLELVRIRWVARQVIQQILRLLLAPLIPPHSIMYQTDYAFPNAMSACYFDGEVETDKGTKKIGLRKQGVGRYFDLVKSLCQCRYATEIPELLLLMVHETLTIPYYIEMRGGVGKVVEKGFTQDMQEKKKLSNYRQLSHIAEGIYQLTSTFVLQFRAQLLETYSVSETNDLMYRVLLNVPQNAYELGDRIIVKKLIEYFIAQFSLTQTPPLPLIHHALTSKDVRNVVQKGYETDMARRLLEMAVLKRELICLTGVGLVQVLKQETFRDRVQFTRAKCQQFRINRNTERILTFGVDTHGGH